MPPLSTHIRLATLIRHRLNTSPNEAAFLLGTIAPDAFEPESEESFSQHHFKGKDGRISLEQFIKETDFFSQPSTNPAWSFHCGYYSHLWLDVYYQDHADRLPVRRPVGMADTELRNLIRRESEILNAACVLAVGHLLNARSEDLSLPVSLEFVKLERCFELFRKVLKQSQAWSQLVPTFESIDEGEYTSFFEDLAQRFTRKIQNAA